CQALSAMVGNVGLRREGPQAAYLTGMACIVGRRSGPCARTGCSQPPVRSAVLLPPAAHQSPGVALRFGAAGSAQHARQLTHPVVILQGTRRGRGSAFRYLLLNGKMMVRQGRDLREVRDAHNLARVSEDVQPLSHGFGYGATDPG